MLKLPLADVFWFSWVVKRGRPPSRTPETTAPTPGTDGIIAEIKYLVFVAVQFVVPACFVFEPSPSSAASPKSSSPKSAYPLK